MALGLFALCVLWTANVPRSWNDIARVAAIESLVERGTWAIDDSPWFEQTQDKVFFADHYYSDKLPLLSWAGAGAYSILRGGAGMSLAADCTARFGCAYYFLTLLFIGVLAAVLIWLVFQFGWRESRSLLVAAVLTVAVGLGTMILPYSLVLNHHLPAAVSLFAAFLLLTGRREPSGFLIGLVGFLSALAVVLDPLAGIFAAALVVCAVLRYRRRAVLLIPGGLLPLLVTAALDYQAIGTPVPAYLIPGGYAFPGSVFPATVGGNGTPDDLPQYAFKMFLGAQGLFAYNPLLFFGLAGIVIAALTRSNPLRREAIVFGLAVIALGVYLATRTGNLGGEAYGERWYVQAVPIVMAFSVFCPPLARVPKYPWVRWLTVPLFGVLLLVSVYSSYQGSRNPWRFVPPPYQLSRNPQTGVIGWRSNVRFP